ncbi:cytochrome c oxidase subunit 3 [Gammaproteobacteria bacterium]|jgi:cytochrome c oxidase subunit 3|nr:cytochrome c oxidase subunit 3 [Gammaproteobacteria bacterium]|tara:strand:+ start:7111 stop:8028 length:918 start_codon:yes stop_codon:yes gene_type:complete
MSGGNYYVPDSSRYPIFAAVSLFLLVMGAGGTINGTANGAAVLYVGFASMAVTMFFWFRTVVQEHLAGLDSAQLKKSYVFGMAWFIFSEVMFFGAFFGALFYVRTFAVPWLAGEGEKGAPIEFVQEMGVDFWTGFENTWPVIATPDAGDGYVMADKSMAFPGWSHVLEWLPLWNTIILLSSSVTVHFAHLGLKNGSRKSFNKWLGVTVGLAVIFLGLQAAEYYEAYAHYGLTLNSGIYGSTFFMLTGFHGFHVFLGCCMLSVMLVRSVFFNHFETHDHFGFEAASWYWHFVDVVWVMLFFFVYII